MLEYATFFLALAVTAAILGFFGLVGDAALIAQFLFVAFVGIFLFTAIRYHPQA